MSFAIQMIYCMVIYVALNVAMYEKKAYLRSWGVVMVTLEMAAMMLKSLSQYDSVLMAVFGPLVTLAILVLAVRLTPLRDFKRK